MIHCGNAGKEWKILHKRLQRIAFLSDNQLTENTELKHYSAVLVDEAHLLSSEKLQILLTQSEGVVSCNIFQRFRRCHMS